MTRPRARPMVWRVLRDPPQPGALNMALDELLAREVGAEEWTESATETVAAEAAGERAGAVLRLYAWSSPTVSLGRNEPTAGPAKATAPAPPASSGGVTPERGSPAPPLDVVRRPTGGRAVLHDAEVTYAVVVPYRAFGGPRETYRRINEALAAALRSLGADVSVAAEPKATPRPGAGAGARLRDAGTGAAVDQAATRTLPLDAGPCFQSPAPGEVVAAGRKLVGSAQARIGRALLQHGSIILRGDQARLAELDPKAASVEQPATLEELIGTVTFDDVADAVERAVVDVLGGGGRAGEALASSWSDEERARAATLVEEKYGTSAWTWRR